MRFTLNQSFSRLQRLYMTGVVSFGLITIFASCGGSNGGDSSANNAPTATITSPADSGLYVYGDTITFTGTGNDTEDGDLSEDSLVWTSDIDGEIGTGSSFTRDDLSPGDHSITLTATDSKGTTGSISIMISVNVAPTATITSPADSSVYVYGDTITFTGTGNDTEDGDLSEDSLVWTSDIDGEIGTGSSFTRDDLSPGDHPITLTATDSKGTTGSNIVNITVRGWRHPASIDDNISPGGQDTMDPEVAMDNSGNAIITWMQYDNSNWQIFKSEYRNGAWTHPSSLDDNISPDGQHVGIYPKVAMDNSGNAIITWMQRNNDDIYQIFKSEYRNGAWTHPSGLDDNISPDGQNAYNPQVAMDNNGNAIITWNQSDGNNSQIFKSEYRNEAWIHPSGLDDNISPDGHGAYHPQVAMDNNDNVIITWSQTDDTLYDQIFLSECRNGAWTHPSGLTDNISFDGEDAWHPKVAMDNSGNAIITWRQLWELAPSWIFKSEYRNGDWSHPDSLDDHISPEGATDPQVTMDNRGNAIITWMGSDGINDQIFMSEYRNGAWTHPASLDDHISPDGQDAGWYPQVAMDNNGNAIITWYQVNDDGVFQIFKSEYRNDAWIHPSDLADNISPDDRNAYTSQVAMDNNGNAIITWVQPDGSNLQIFKSEYR